MHLRCLKSDSPYSRLASLIRQSAYSDFRCNSSVTTARKHNGPVFHEEPLGYPADKGYGFLNIDIGQPIGGKERYIVVRKLGYGAYSSVWLTKDTQ